MICLGLLCVTIGFNSGASARFNVGFLIHTGINPLRAKRRLLYLKTQFIPRSKHFSSRL